MCSVARALSGDGASSVLTDVGDGGRACRGERRRRRSGASQTVSSVDGCRCSQTRREEEAGGAIVARKVTGGGSCAHARMRGDGLVAWIVMALR